MEETNDSFHLKPISKTELARQYMPYLAAHSAVNRLVAWINGCPALLEKLHETGYRKSQKLFTSRQHALILEFLGEP